MDRAQQIEKANIYRCGKTLHYFDGGDEEGTGHPLQISKTYESISRAKREVGPCASCVAERPGENLYRKMQARWEARLKDREALSQSR